MTWRLSFLGPAKVARGPDDPVFQDLQRVAAVESRGTPRIDSATSAMKGDLAEYVVDVEADDAASAEKIVRKAIGPQGEIAGGITVVELT